MNDRKGQQVVARLRYRSEDGGILQQCGELRWRHLVENVLGDCWRNSINGIGVQKDLRSKYRQAVGISGLSTPNLM